MSADKPKVEGTVRVNAYRVVQDAVENGFRLGYKRAHKHTDTPGEDVILEHVSQAIMNELCEYLVFDE